MITERCEGCWVYAVAIISIVWFYIVYTMWFKRRLYLKMSKCWAKENSLEVLSLRFAPNAAVESEGKPLVLTFHLVISDGMTVRSGLVGAGEFSWGLINNKMVFKWD